MWHVGNVWRTMKCAMERTTKMIETTTGGVEATLAAGVILSGDISLTSTTGGVKLDWNNVIATQDLQLDVQIKNVSFTKNYLFQ